MNGILSYFTDTIHVTRPATKVVRGSSVPDWDNATEHDETMCRCDPVDTSYEDEGRASNQTTRAKLYAPQGADIRRGDRVDAISETWTVVESHPIHRSPTGRLTHLQFDLERWEG